MGFNGARVRTDQRVANIAKKETANHQVRHEGHKEVPKRVPGVNWKETHKQNFGDDVQNQLGLTTQCSASTSRSCGHPVYITGTNGGYHPHETVWFETGKQSIC